MTLSWTGLGMFLHKDMVIAQKIAQICIINSAIHSGFE